MTVIISKTDARAMMLAAQGLLIPFGRKAGKSDVMRTIRRMGALQIDTINIVARSPYFVLWSRLGSYEPRWLDELLAGGKLFEYWSHEASYLPIDDYPLYRHRMLNAESMGWKYRTARVESHRVEINRLLERIRKSGPVRSSDFESDERKKGGWWEWKAEKLALEALFTAGELMIARRENFRRVYDLRQRVLPAWNDSLLKPVEDVRSELALKSVRALGICKAGWVSDYFRSPKRETLQTLSALANKDALVLVEVEGWNEPAFVHPDNVTILKKAIAGKLKPALTTLLSPFDPLIWDRDRLRVTFDFAYALECYKPASKRQYGYFVLPILHRGTLVGRLDAKAHRKERLFEVKSVYMEPRVRINDEMITSVALAIKDCAAWHRTPGVIVRRSEPAGVAGRLLSAIKIPGEIESPAV